MSARLCAAAAGLVILAATAWSQQPPPSPGEQGAAPERPQKATEQAIPDNAQRLPRGLFVCRGPNATPEKEVDFPFIAGWLVRPGWDAVEPRAGEYDWSYVENEIALARKLKKRITLAVLGGPQAPDWVYQAGAGEFAFKLPIGRAGEARIPLPWDEAYLLKWTALIHELGRRFDKDDTVALVHMTGATGNGLEMQLPFMPAELARWRQAGYSPEKVAASWKRIINAFAEAFPDKPLDIDVHPVLDSDQVAQEVAEYGHEKIGARFGIFGGWLSGKDAADDRHHAGMHALAAKYGPMGFAAFQMIASRTRTPNQFADGGLKTAVEQGMRWGARYFEIWETDAMNPKLQPELTDLAAKLATGP